MVYGMFSQTLEKAVSLGMFKSNRAKQVGTVPKEKVKVEFWTKEEFQKYCLHLIWKTFMNIILSSLFGYIL